MLVHVRLIPFGTWSGPYGPTFFCFLLFTCPLIKGLGLYFISYMPWGTQPSPFLSGFACFAFCDYFALWFMHDYCGCMWRWILARCPFALARCFFLFVVLLWLFHPIGKALMRWDPAGFTFLLYAFVYGLLFCAWQCMCLFMHVVVELGQIPLLFLMSFLPLSSYFYACVSCLGNLAWFTHFGLAFFAFSLFLYTWLNGW